MMTGYSCAEVQVRRALWRVLRIFSKATGLELDEAHGQEAVEIRDTGQDQEKFRRCKEDIFFLTYVSR